MLTFYISVSLSGSTIFNCTLVSTPPDGLGIYVANLSGGHPMAHFTLLQTQMLSRALKVGTAKDSSFNTTCSSPAREI